MRSLTPVRLLSAGLILLAMGWLWMRFSSPGKASEPAAARVPLVAVTPVQRMTMEERVEEMVSLRAPLTVNVGPRMTGRVLSVGPFEGDAVREGEEVARVESLELEAELRRAQALLTAAERRLREARLGAEPQRRQVETAVEQAQAELSTAEAELRRATLSVSGRTVEARTLVDQAETKLALEQKQLKRHEDLLAKDMIAAAEVDQVRARVDLARSEVEAAKRRASVVQTEVGADVEVAREAVKRARARLNAALANRAQNPMYQEQVATLEASVDERRAAVENARAALAQTLIRSPLTGFVTARLLDPGAVAGPSQPILTVMNITPIWAEASLPEEQARRIPVGSEARVTLDALPDAPRRGRVIHLNPAANPQSRSFLVRVRLENPDHALKPGMFGKVTFPVRRVKDAMVVPSEAVVEDGGAFYVYVVDGDTVRRAAVKVGLRREGRSEIVEGVRAGQKVVVMGQERLEDGDRVRVEGQRT